MLFKLINILKCLKKCLVNIYFLINLFIFETRNFYDVRLQFCQKSQKAVLTWCTETAKKYENDDGKIYDKRSEVKRQRKNLKN